MMQMCWKTVTLKLKRCRFVDSQYNIYITMCPRKGGPEKYYAVQRYGLNKVLPIHVKIVVLFTFH